MGVNPFSSEEAVAEVPAPPDMTGVPQTACPFSAGAMPMQTGRILKGGMPDIQFRIGNLLCSGPMCSLWNGTKKLCRHVELAIETARLADLQEKTVALLEKLVGAQR